MSPRALFCGTLIFLFSVIPAFSLTSRLERGITLYGESRWREAVIELRRAEAEARNTDERAEALYWISLAELSAGEYGASLEDMEELERAAPESRYAGELSYHKGRVLFYLGRWDESAVLLRDYADNTGDAVKKAAALYWIGESLFAMGQFEEARDVFALITEQYPQSAKFEAASYRLALINQKKVESELLEMLKWSHEESLKSVEDYQRRERFYDQALVAYQKRFADLDGGGLSAEEYRRQLSAAEARISELEALLNISGGTDRQRRLREIRNQAVETEEYLQSGRSGGGQ
ncbi:MAG: tetratricopeptide repeat protein [Treponema sp.]|jgi:tetratricopeptide (TPR) repeat protein|nr:tetratricopeptide repeat protein [Treponema sp.]